MRQNASFPNRLSPMPRRKKPLNLKDVAQILGVSTATVSNAFNRPDQLSKKLREKILKETAELGYFGPNLAARSLRKGQSDVIAVVLADTLSYSFSDPVASQFLQGVSEVLAEHKKQLLLLSSRFTSTEQSSAESLPDGFIFYGAPQDDTYQRVQRTGKAVIAVDFEPGNAPAINIDNREAAKKSALHALQHSSDKAAIISLSLLASDRVCRLTEQDLHIKSSVIAHMRLQGYLDACQELGVVLPANMIWHTPLNTPEVAEIAAFEALTSHPRPDVILCMSDVIALSVMRTAEKLNVAIPAQLRVVGFDDIPEAARVSPGLTTVCQQSIEKGRAAARVLLEPDTPQNMFPETQLILRGSTGD